MDKLALSANSLLRSLRSFVKKYPTLANQPIDVLVTGRRRQIRHGIVVSMSSIDWRHAGEGMTLNMEIYLPPRVRKRKTNGRKPQTGTMK